MAIADIERAMQKVATQLVESKLREQLHLEEKAKHEAEKARVEADQARAVCEHVKRLAEKTDADLALPKFPRLGHD